MIGWSFRQLTGKAPTPLQRKNARVAATFNIGGPICASVCTVLAARTELNHESGARAAVRDGGIDRAELVAPHL